jgi:hypothetical protein
MSKEARIAAPVESTEAINFMTMKTLVQSLDGVMHQLRCPTNLDGEEIKTRALDGGVRSALEMVAITMCNRLADVASDSTRWTAKPGLDRWAQEAALRTAALAELEERREAIRVASSPAIRMQAGVIRRGDEFCVFVGKPGTQTFFFGLGKTVEEAIAEFNRQFALPVDKINTVVIDNDAPQPKPTRKKKDTNDKVEPSNDGAAPSAQG